MTLQLIRIVYIYDMECFNSIQSKLTSARCIFCGGSLSYMYASVRVNLGKITARGIVVQQPVWALSAIALTGIIANISQEKTSKTVDEDCCYNKKGELLIQNTSSYSSIRLRCVGPSQI